MDGIGWRGGGEGEVVRVGTHALLLASRTNGQGVQREGQRERKTENLVPVAVPLGAHRLEADPPQLVSVDAACSTRHHPLPSSHGFFPFAFLPSRYCLRVPLDDTNHNLSTIRQKIAIGFGLCEAKSEEIGLFLVCFVSIPFRFIRLIRCKTIGEETNLKRVRKIRTKNSVKFCLECRRALATEVAPSAVHPLEKRGEANGRNTQQEQSSLRRRGGRSSNNNSSSEIVEIVGLAKQPSC